MELLMQLNRAVEYIEAHICDDLALGDISRVTSYSVYHFGRLFYYIAQMSLSEYIRRRKLSLAAAELQGNSVKVIDLAVKYGYDSADSFTRAFAKQHGITPTAARRRGAMLTIFPPLSFQIQIKGVQGMNWRIEEREAFEVFGVERIFGNDEVGIVPDFWTELRENGEMDKLIAATNGEDTAVGEDILRAVCGYNEVEGDRFPYLIGAIKTPDCNTAGYTIAKVPRSTWAVFRSEKVDYMGVAMKELFDRAYQEWLPSSDYEWAAMPDLELYYTTADGKFYDECWIPIKKKQGKLPNS